MNSKSEMMRSWVRDHLRLNVDFTFSLMRCQPKENLSVTNGISVEHGGGNRDSMEHRTGIEPVNTGFTDEINAALSATY
jgi:hypothetical protein